MGNSQLLLVSIRQINRLPLAAAAAANAANTAAAADAASAAAADGRFWQTQGVYLLLQNVVNKTQQLASRRLVLPASQSAEQQDMMNVASRQLALR